MGLRFVLLAVAFSTAAFADNFDDLLTPRLLQPGQFQILAGELSLRGNSDYQKTDKSEFQSKTSLVSMTNEEVEGTAVRRLTELNVNAASNAIISKTITANQNHIRSVTSCYMAANVEGRPGKELICTTAASQQCRAVKDFANSTSKGLANKSYVNAQLTADIIKKEFSLRERYQGSGGVSRACASELQKSGSFAPNSDCAFYADYVSKMLVASTLGQNNRGQYTSVAQGDAKAVRDALAKLMGWGGKIDNFRMRPSIEDSSVNGMATMAERLSKKPAVFDLLAASDFLRSCEDTVFGKELLKIPGSPSENRQPVR